jgi:hypothetical protein
MSLREATLFNRNLGLRATAVTSLAVLLTATSACADLTATQPANESSRSLYEAIATAARGGAELVCDPQKLSKVLGVALSDPKKSVYQSSTESEQVVSTAGNLAVKSGVFRTFRSDSTAFCSIKVVLEKPSLCRYWEAEVSTLMGVSPRDQSVGPHSSDYFPMYRLTNSVSSTDVLFGTEGATCSREFSISSTWLKTK